MLWYIFAFVLSMLFASAAQSLKGKSNLEVDGGSFHFRSSYCCMTLLSFLPVFIVAAIRYEVGTDWPIYLDYYHWINEGTKGFSEKLFNLLNKIVGRTEAGFQWVVILVALLSYFFLFKAIYVQRHIGKNRSKSDPRPVCIRNKKSALLCKAFFLFAKHMLQIFACQNIKHGYGPVIQQECHIAEQQQCRHHQSAHDFRHQNQHDQRFQRDDDDIE